MYISLFLVKINETTTFSREKSVQSTALLLSDELSVSGESRKSSSVMSSERQDLQKFLQQYFKNVLLPLAKTSCNKQSPNGSCAVPQIPSKAKDSSTKVQTCDVRNHKVHKVLILNDSDKPKSVSSPAVNLAVTLSKKICSSGGLLALRI